MFWGQPLSLWRKPSFSGHWIAEGLWVSRTRRPFLPNLSQGGQSFLDLTHQIHSIRSIHCVPRPPSPPISSSRPCEVPEWAVLNFLAVFPFPSTAPAVALIPIVRIDYGLCKWSRPQGAASARVCKFSISIQIPGANAHLAAASRAERRVGRRTVGHSCRKGERPALSPRLPVMNESDPGCNFC